MRGDWQYETCKCCTREQRVAWFVSDKLWKKVIISYYHKLTLCLECFLRMADDRGVSVSLGDIHFVGLVERKGER